MYSTSEIVENILHNIKLQEKLCEKVVEEHRCFTADTLDDPDEIIREQIQLEKEIGKINKSIADLAVKHYINSKGVDEKNKVEVTLLMDKLYKSMEKTIGFISKKIKLIEEEKNATGKLVKKLGKGRTAINSYAKYGTI